MSSNVVCPCFLRKTAKHYQVYRLDGLVRSIPAPQDRGGDTGLRTKVGLEQSVELRARSVQLRIRKLDLDRVVWPQVGGQALDVDAGQPVAPARHRIDLRSAAACAAAGGCSTRRAPSAPPWSRRFAGARPGPGTLWLRLPARIIASPLKVGSIVYAMKIGRGHARSGARSRPGPRQLHHRAPLGHGQQVALVCDPLIVEGQHVHDERPGVQQCDGRVAGRAEW